MFARVTGALGGILLPAGAALAQQEYESVPLSYKEVSTTIPWVIGAVFVLATLVVAFKPAKRSNLK